MPNISNKDFPRDIEFNAEFKAAFELIENTNECIFITGRAGTGKSTLLRLVKEKTRKNTVVLAPTGVSAINVTGQTIHSFFKFPPKFIQRQDIRRLRNRRLLEKIELIIIDEVSMVRADLLDAIDAAMRLNRGFDVPFGGAQVVMFGDLFQLPPVIKGRELLDFFEKHYGSQYFFDAHVFKDVKLKFIELHKIYRQSDAEFIELLEKIRNKRQLREALEILNKRWQEELPRDGHQGITLTTTNDTCLRINEEHLKRLVSLEYHYQAQIDEKFEDSFFPTEYDLKLKAGAQVMLIRNDPEKRWVNGTIARIAQLNEDMVKISVGDNVYELEKQTWSKVEYRYDKQEDTITEELIGSFLQYPLKLAWAITIHKSQGKTFDKVIIDLGRGAFAHGQVYVALSRCSSLEGIVLKRPVHAADIVFDSKIYDFRERFLKVT
ncbi:MAG: DEAD/DEAH box helicase [Candidatus Omnitrophica bacterium]|nr:DEAD/DEAH box helicase [Candidatus Omnitrophota bacterium]